MNRPQKVVVIQRVADDQFYCAPKGALSPNWTADIRMANLVAPSKVKGLIRATWGHDMAQYRTIEVVPVPVDTIDGDIVRALDAVLFPAPRGSIQPKPASPTGPPPPKPRR